MPMTPRQRIASATGRRMVPIQVGWALRAWDSVSSGNTHFIESVQSIRIRKIKEGFSIKVLATANVPDREVREDVKVAIFVAGWGGEGRTAWTAGITRLNPGTGTEQRSGSPTSS